MTVFDGCVYVTLALIASLTLIKVVTVLSNISFRVSYSERANRGHSHKKEDEHAE